MRISVPFLELYYSRNTNSFLVISSMGAWNQNFWKRWASQLLFYSSFFKLRNEGKSQECLWLVWKSMENVLWFYNKSSSTDLLCVWELIYTLKMLQIQLKQLKYKSLLAPPRKNTLLCHTALTNEWERSSETFNCVF